MSFWRQTLATALGVVLGGLVLWGVHALRSDAQRAREAEAARLRAEEAASPERLRQRERALELMRARFHDECLDAEGEPTAFTSQEWDAIRQRCAREAERRARAQLD